MSDTSTIIFLREVLNGAAVKERCAIEGGDSSPYHAGVMQGVSLALAAMDCGTTDELVTNARIRSREIMRQDYRRELDLYDKQVRRFG